MSDVCSRALTRLLRARYAIVAAVGGLWFWRQYVRFGANHPSGDWLFFKIGAFVFEHYDKDFDSSRLHLYVDYPTIQIGPPPLAVVAVLQSLLPIWLATLTAALLMTAAAVLIVYLLERTAALVGPSVSWRHRAALALLGGIILVLAFANNAATYRHLDDTMALTGVVTAVWLVARSRPSWLIALVLGTAVASKPWAIVAVPLILGCPRNRRAMVGLETLGVAALWWVPFVLAAPQSIQSLGAKALYPMGGSVLFAVGAHGNESSWLRATQFSLGALAATLVAMRSSWLASASAGLAVSLALSPYAWPYYGMGPLVAALAVDLLLCRRPVPWWTASAGIVMYLLPAVHAGPELIGLSRLAWVLTIVAVFATQSRPRHVPTVRARDLAVALR